MAAMRYQSRFLQVLFAIFLFSSLLAGGTALAIRNATGDPGKAKSWLNQSGFYPTLVQDRLSGLVASISDNTQLSTLGLSQTDLQNAIKASIPKDLAVKDTSTFVDSNYAWLGGQAQKPEFKIDLKPVEDAFSQNASSYISARIDKLPACSTSQLLTAAQQGTGSFMSLGCKPSGFDSSSIASLVPDFLTQNGLTQNISFTADDLRLGSGGAPYYKQIGSAPRYFQLAKHATTYLAIGTILSIALIIFFSRTLGAGLRAVAWAAGLAGLLLATGGLVAKGLEQSFENHVLGKLDFGIFKSSMSVFLTNAWKDFARTEIVAGIVLAGVALLLTLSPRIMAVARQARAK
jgi:hypothetical protein